MFGRFPALTMPAICGVGREVGDPVLGQRLVRARRPGSPRSEPPRNAGIVLPAMWLGIGKAPMSGFSFGLPAFGSSA